MDKSHMIILIVTLSSSLVLFIVLFLICVCKRNKSARNESWDKEANTEFKLKETGVEETEMKDVFVKFEGGEDLTCFDILDAPGEVIGKSSYGTLYRANLLNGSVLLLRFLRPACCTIDKVQDVMHVVQLLGSVRHPNLVPLCGFYSGPRGEKLLVGKFGSLYQSQILALLTAIIQSWLALGIIKFFLSKLLPPGNFLHKENGIILDLNENGETHKWEIIYRISMGIVRGLYHLHTRLQKPIIHGNLKSKNIFLGRNHQPYVSDFGLRLLLNPAASQEMVEDAAVEGYKAPELTKTKDFTTATDIYNLGVILLELITGKEPINGKANSNRDSYLPIAIRNAILDHRMSDLYHPNVLEHDNGGSRCVSEDIIIKFVKLALDCCSPSPSLRPDIKQICKEVEEIGTKY
ncbi:hypothetical protein QVD17_35747 [Tagetes erecta]|uniref:Protein kinase domain-containing protein n=1 Tax=Tagetes erecta TaxID=13708 RepID=A0AAD8JRC6_TARER|nr:hypothetical protein QVD17_35747 [Tagetes erecta]